MQPTNLSNRTCAYCGVDLSTTDWNKEHVIGKRFVPKGTLVDRWNLLLRTCVVCNNRKSELEDDISAISMQPDVAGHYPQRPDSTLEHEAIRKGSGSSSRRTGKLVSKSQEEVKLRLRFGSVALAPSFVGPPQADPDRLFTLARLQVIGFMYWLTYDERRRSGRFPRGGFSHLRPAMRADWGNVVHQSFMRRVLDWELKLLVCTARGYFRAAIRQHGDGDCWSWALEWNQNYRIIGFLGEEEASRGLVATLPELEYGTIELGGEQRIRHWSEVALEEADDCLFQHVASPQGA